MTIGRSIQAHRKKRNLTIQQLGALSGVSAGSIGSYERGVTIPKRRALEKIARALDIPPEKLLPEPEYAAPRDSGALLYDGVLALLKARYGAVEGCTVVGEGGSCRRTSSSTRRTLPPSPGLHRTPCLPCWRACAPERPHDHGQGYPRPPAAARADAG